MNEDNRIAQFREELIESGRAEEDDLVGCIEAEIESLEQEFNVELPRTYRRFLQKMGKSSGDLFVGSDFHYPTLFKMRDFMERRLDESGATFELSETDFVFFNHQGYSFLYFDTAAGDDPPVYRYVEKDDLPEKITDSLTEFLYGALEDN